MKNECSMAKKIESFKKNEKGGIGNTGMWFDFYDSEEDANGAADTWNKAHPKRKKKAHVTPWTSADGKEQKWICWTYESCKNSEKRTVTKSYDVYTYDELSPEAKEKVKQLFLGWRGEDGSLFTESCETILTELFPTSDLNVQYDLGYSQGDGFNTYGTLKVSDLLNVNLSEYPLKDSGITPLSNVDAIKAACDKGDIYNIELERNNHYCYSLADGIEIVSESDDLTPEELDLLNELETFARNVMGRINKVFEDDGYDYFYEMDEDEVKDMADANGYEFTEDGTLA